jgi:hypothetical protein
MVVTPLHQAGTRSEPAMSLPWWIGPNPATVAAALPDELPARRPGATVAGRAVDRIGRGEAHRQLGHVGPAHEDGAGPAQVGDDGGVSRAIVMARAGRPLGWAGLDVQVLLDRTGRRGAARARAGLPGRRGRRRATGAAQVDDDGVDLGVHGADALDHDGHDLGAGEVALRTRRSARWPSAARGPCGPDGRTGRRRQVRPRPSRTGRRRRHQGDQDQRVEEEGDC